MLVIKTKNDLRAELDKIDKELSLGFVPTMGALHEGHVSLIKRAAEENNHVVISIFVNPTQFNNSEDLEKYPKTLDNDINLIRTVTNDAIVFAPSVTEIYEKDVTHKLYDFDGLDKVMEGEFRDNHFNGVGTIVEKLLRLVSPNKAYFGEKDFQQLRIIQKMTELQHIPVEILGCEIVREKNGLAMSSRNERLSDAIRLKAAFIYETLKTAKQKFGTENVVSIKNWVNKTFEQNVDFQLEYFEITDSATLTPAKKKHNNIKYRAFIAAYAENVRLIDNLALN